ncbi:MAG: type II toxin-antitoxin system RelE/ParE family toxin [Pseudomonadota bacterium]|nr:type II toxin-antitoxin system RelE/ParE family toxin [Pseudomonadota bacterium]
MASVRTTEVFDAWFAALRDRQARARIAVRIQRLATGNPGQHRNLTGGVAEMKIDYGPGYRVYYTERAGITYVLLCGGDKASQQGDITTALNLARLMEAGHEQGSQDP